MPPSQHVLVVLDPMAKHQPALERAEWYAEQSGAALELFICDYEQGFYAAPPFEPAAVERARRNLIASHLTGLKEHARRLARRGIEVSVDARWDHPLAAAIIRKAIESKADFVVKDTHHYPVLRRSVFSNTDWVLIRSCPVFLWLVKPRPIAETPCIIAAVDPLHEHDKLASLDDRILSSAKSLRWRQGEIRSLQSRTSIQNAGTYSIYIKVSTENCFAWKLEEWQIEKCGLSAH
jgi:universal stress protein E